MGLVGFATGIAICTGVTALPVLSAILLEMDLLASRIGQLAIAIAAANDMALWMLLGALLPAVSGATLEGVGTSATLMLFSIYLIVMFKLAGPLIGEAVSATMQDGRLSNTGLTLVCGLILVSASITSILGVHDFLGAFIAGLVVPGRLSRALQERLQIVVFAALMPFYFTSTGLRTVIEFQSAAFWEIFAAATACAVVGKMGGTAIAARLVGESWPVALGLGALIQTKGVMDW